METIKILDEQSIIRATSIQIEEGLIPYRIVLRHSGEGFSSHRENLQPKQNDNVLEFHHRDFYWGHYFRTREEAEKDFEERK